MRWIALVLAAIAVIGSACGGDTEEGDQRPSGTTLADAGGSVEGGTDGGGAAPDGIHRPCPAAGCVAGQECVTSTTSEGTVSTCEIKCTSNDACPPPLHCNLPPVVPDSLPNTCVE